MPRIESRTWQLGLDERPDWMLDALCQEFDPDMFYPPKGGSPHEAKQVCRRCLVTDECLAFALEHRETEGVWGGLSERQRRDLRSRADRPRRRLEPCGTPAAYRRHTRRKEPLDDACRNAMILHRAEQREGKEGAA